MAIARTQKMQRAQSVLAAKLESDTRTHHNALAAAARERAALEEQLAVLESRLAERDRDARGQALAARTAQKRLEDARSAAARAIAASDARVAAAVSDAELRHKALQDAQVHLMLCVLHDDSGSAREDGGSRGGSGSSGDRAAAAVGSMPAAMQRACAPAASLLQGAGCEARPPRSSAAAAGAQHCSVRAAWSSTGGSESSFAATSTCVLEQAALRLQAGARGYLARRRVHALRQEAAAVVVVQVRSSAHTRLCSLVH
jgi:hypothetical protein